MRGYRWTKETFIDFIKLALAALLIFAPWMFGFASSAVASGNAWISGALIGLASVAAIVALADWEEWVSLVLGLWVVISPWVLGYHAAFVSAMRANVAIGIAVALFAAAELLIMHHDSPPQVTA
jgi:SPW repeat